jgi:hypothetical protein
MTDHNDLRKAARIVFGTTDGKILMDHIRRLYYDSAFKTNDPYEVMRNVGRRDVVLSLLRLIGGQDE